MDTPEAITPIRMCWFAMHSCETVNSICSWLTMGRSVERPVTLRWWTMWIMWAIALHRISISCIVMVCQRIVSLWSAIRLVHMSVVISRNNCYFEWRKSSVITSFNWFKMSIDRQLVLFSFGSSAAIDYRPNPFESSECRTCTHFANERRILRRFRCDRTCGCLREQWTQSAVLCRCK